MAFEPDFNHLIDAALNREAKRLPLYEHGFDAGVVEQVIGEPVKPLLQGSYADRVEGLRRVVRCGMQLGYDCIPFERGMVEIVQKGQGLMGRAASIITSKQDIEAYPWDRKPAEYIELYAQDFDALREALPPGMKAVGGIGYGLFETLQDFVPLQELGFLEMDEPEVYEQLWCRVGDMMVSIWEWLLANHSDSFAVLRFGDDLGFRSSTLISPEQIRRHVIPQYKRVVDRVHAAGKPFLLHSCGRIYDVMEDLINVVGIDAKHSNEDAIDVFDVWVNRYGDRIGNFGGVEMNLLTNNTPDEVKAYVLDLLRRITGRGGLAIGSGNQISPYTKPENWIAMTQAVRQFRGE